MNSRISIATVASIGIFAFGLEAVVHEVLGHAVVCWLIGGKVILISSTAMQTASASRLVPAAGPIANIVFGLAALLLFRAISLSKNNHGENNHDENRCGGANSGDTNHGHANKVGLLRLFLYFFAFANLFLASGYILYSGLIRFGDFATVIDGLQPAWLYRAVLVIAGGLGYRYGIVQAAQCLAVLPTRDDGVPGSSPLPAAPAISLPDARRIVYAGCAAGGGLFLLASIFNPISPSLILYDGLSGAVGMTLGFFLALTDLRQSARSPSSEPSTHLPAQEPATPISIPFSLTFTIAAAIFVVAYLFTMGHGIRIS